MVLYNAKCASVGHQTHAADGKPISMYATVGTSMFTNLVPRLFVMLVTVATGNHLLKGRREVKRR